MERRVIEVISQPHDLSAITMLVLELATEIDGLKQGFPQAVDRLPHRGADPPLSG